MMAQARREDQAVGGMELGMVGRVSIQDLYAADVVVRAREGAMTAVLRLAGW